MNRTFYRVWKYPILLGALTLFGLLAALTGSEAWHVLSWTALAIPLAVCVRFGFLKR